MTLSAQTLKVTGMVKDTSGKPIINAIIQVIGKPGLGGVTNLKGVFAIPHIPEKSKLKISYIGYKTREVDLSKEPTPLSIILEEDRALLDEVLVVGYTTTTKRSLSASVAHIDTKTMGKIPASSITQVLAGRAPGLIVETKSGINATSGLSIRGGDPPLYVVDGIIRSFNDFANINPNDIESITLLKDASSAAIYGARAANGIIQVTTKMGSVEQKPSVTYSLTHNWSQPTIFPKRVNSYQMAKIINEAQENEGNTPTFTEEELHKFRDGSDPQNYPNTDWVNLVLNKWATNQVHNLSISGGTQINQYYLSLGYTKMNSLLKSGRYYGDRFNFNLSNRVNFSSSGLSLFGQVTGFFEDLDDTNTSEGQGIGYILDQVATKLPNEIGINKYGLPYDIANNPIADSSQEAGYIRNKDKVFNGLFELRWDVPFITGLAIKSLNNYNYYIKEGKEWRKDAPKYSWDSKIPKYASNPRLRHLDEQGYSFTNQDIISYESTFSEIHEVQGLLGFEMAYNKEFGKNLERIEYLINVDQIRFGPTDEMNNDAWDAESGRASFFGQFKYGLLHRYYLQGSIRRDGSDHFPVNKRWGNFFSISAAWTLSDEPFFTSLRNHHILDLFKLRGSFGTVGLDNTTAFQYLQKYAFEPSGYVFDGKMVPRVYENGVPSPNITWYTDHQYGVGFDLGALKDRLYGNFDYYLFVTTGYLANPDPLKMPYLDPYGRKLPQEVSDGEKRRSGMDLSIGYRDNIGDFTFDVGVNYTYYRTFWARFPWEPLDLLKNPYLRYTGNEDNFLEIGYELIKTADSAQEWKGYAQHLGSTNLNGGDYIYKDTNGDGKLDEQDQRKIGRRQAPAFNYGIHADFTYKGLSLNLLFQGAGMRDVKVNKDLWENNFLSSYDFQLDYWTPERTKAKFPRILSSQSVNGNNNLENSLAWVYDGSFFRLKNLALSYDLKYSLLKEVKWLDTCTVTLTGQNLLTFSETMRYGFDPESTGGVRDYPIERVFGLSFNVGL